MRNIIINELTEEKFKLYGEFKNMFSTDEYLLGEKSSSEFHPDIIQIDLGNKTPSFSIARIFDCDRIIENIEYHRYTSEGILPLDGDCIIFVGRSSWMIDPNSIEAFRVSRGTLVKLNPGVIHGRQYTIGKECVNVMIILPIRTYGNDCEFIPLTEDQKIRINIDENSILVK